MAYNGEINGYLGSLYMNASCVTVLEIKRYYISGGSQQRISLGTVACPYTIGEDVKLEFSTVGSTLTITASTTGDVIIVSLQVTDTNCSLPDAFGICGETPDSSSTIELDNIYAEPHSTIKTRITD